MPSQKSYLFYEYLVPSCSSIFFATSSFEESCIILTIPMVAMAQRKLIEHLQKYSTLYVEN